MKDFVQYRFKDPAIAEAFGAAFGGTALVESSRTARRRR